MASRLSDKNTSFSYRDAHLAIYVFLMAFKMTNAELLFEFLMKIYSSNFALIRKATVLNYPLPSDLIDVIQHKAFYIII